MAVDVKARMSLDGTGFRQGLMGAERDVQGFTAKLGGVKSAIAGVFGGAMFAGMVRNALSAAGAIEDLETQFKVLLGSTSAAKKRMDELKTFSATTPFQLEDIAEASRLLSLFSGNTLGGTSSLRMIGDAAAAAGKPIQEVGMWVGRLYASLQAGQPIGEATMRLMEMGVITPKLRGELEELNKTTATAEEKFKLVEVAFSRFTGQMEERSKTLNGQISTLKDNWKLAWAEMGDAFKPAAEVIIAGLTKISKFMSGTSTGLRQYAAELGAAAADQEDQPWWHKAAGFITVGAKRNKEGTVSQQDRDRAIQEVMGHTPSAIRQRVKPKLAPVDAPLESIQDPGSGDVPGFVRGTVEDILRKVAAEAKRAADEAADEEADLQKDVSKQAARLREIAEGGGVGGGIGEADRLARIGGYVGTGINPQLQAANRQLRVEEQIRDELKRLPNQLRPFFMMNLESMGLA